MDDPLRSASRGEPGQVATAPEPDETAAAANRNGSTPAASGTTSSAPKTTTAEPGTEANEEHSRMDQAEETVDRLAAKVAGFTSLVGKKAMRAAARLREAASDFWAEAQSIRRGDQS
jgi:hypothetical protein